MIKSLHFVRFEGGIKQATKTKNLDITETVEFQKVFCVLGAETILRM